VAGQVKAVVLASDKPTDENSLDNPRKVAPKDTALQASGNKLRHSFPGNSLTVLRFSAVQ
jgi:alpha-L-arabinofuranosidase